MVSGRPAGSGRPVAAVGAVRRPGWINANGGGAASGSDEVLMDTSPQCRPFPQISGVPYNSNQASMLISDGDAAMPGSLLMNSGCFLPPAMTDEALLASLTAANSSSLYSIDSKEIYLIHVHIQFCIDIFVICDIQPVSDIIMLSCH